MTQLKPDNILRGSFWPEKLRVVEEEVATAKEVFEALKDRYKDLED